MVLAAQCIEHPGAPQQGCGVTFVPVKHAGRPLIITDIAPDNGSTSGVYIAYSYCSWHVYPVNIVFFGVTIPVTASMYVECTSKLVSQVNVILFVFMVTFLAKSALIIAGMSCTPFCVGSKLNGFDITVLSASLLTI